MLGDSLMLLVLSIWVMSLTGSPGTAGLTFLWMSLPALAAPLLGVYVDRVPAKPLLVWGSLASAAIVLQLLWVRGPGQVWVIWAVTFGYGISFIVLPAALNGLLQELMPDRLLGEANASLQTVKEGYRLIGPLVGAGLFAWAGGGAVAILDAVSFTIAAAAVALLPLRKQHRIPTHEPWATQLVAGLRHITGDLLLRHTLVATGLMVLVLGFMESAVYAILDAFDKPATFAGVLVSVQGVGAVLGGLTATRWMKRFTEAGAIVIALGMMVASMAAVAAAPALWMIMAAMVPLGYALPLLLVAFTTLLQRRTPHALIGRASAAVETVTGIPQTLSLAIGALLVAVIDYRIIFTVMAATTLVACCYLVLALRHHLRHVTVDASTTPSGGAGPVPSDSSRR